ncbi:peptide deformylase [Pseudobdellovibrio exovorus]|uniref:Peptide deformylase n=1 Tax=Pseudobdellovibrio exovorus JSS TaxID=1184267 RepID=M4VC45_9BACT|nr:peptide deformylase [Pseudobdellovibrio exovorus]AGH96040.1 polypeptide deformylase [Pseudobdellovibrio exovorus JSS]
MKLEILTYPNPILREVSQPVTEFGPKLKKLVEDMLETMYDASGIGLAAPQVGELLQVLVIDTRPRDPESSRYENDDQTELEKKIKQPLILINPEIIKGEGKTTFDEGCLSVPSFYETVERYEKIEVKAYDVDGKEFHLVTDGLLAICIQHEMDHLAGTLFIDHISFTKSNRIKNQIKKSGYPTREELAAKRSERKKDPVKA